MTVALENVEFEHSGETWIHPTTLQLDPGGFNVLLGTTLSGKTTLMRLMAGLERPTAGRVKQGGEDVTGKPVQKRDVAMVYQQFINYPNFTVYDNIASPLRLKRMSKRDIDAEIKQVAELLQLGPMLKRLPGELSGGQQQRCALARALVKRSDLILLDEPLANLDYKLREELREELPRLFRDAGSTVVYATTEPHEALLLGGHTATLHQGQVTQFGPTSDVYREPNSALSAGVFSDPPINLGSVHKRDGQLHFDEKYKWQIPDVLSAVPDGPYDIGIRPHLLTLEQTAGAVSVTGKVLLSEISGSESTVHARVNTVDWVSLNHGIHVLEPGDEITVWFDPGRCLFFDAEGSARQ